jgi:hypothetical protein
MIYELIFFLTPFNCFKDPNLQGLLGSYTLEMWTSDEFSTICL